MGSSFNWKTLILFGVIVAIFIVAIKGASAAFSEKGRAKYWILTLFLVIGATLVASLLYFFMPFNRVGAPIVIAKTQTSSGHTFVLTQTYTGTLEPYRVALGFCPTNGECFWFNVDHQALYWHSGTIEVAEEAKTARVVKDGQKIATFNWQTWSFTRP